MSVFAEYVYVIQSGYSSNFLFQSTFVLVNGMINEQKPKNIQFYGHTIYLGKIKNNVDWGLL